MKVFVLDRNQKPLMPTHPARARKLLKAGRAVVVKLTPFTIRLKDRTVEESVVQPVRLKFDPGSKVTGIALIREDGNTGEVLHLVELHHKQAIKEKMADRSAFRHRRRTKNLRYRPPRWNNRTRPKGWLPPSLKSRVDNIVSWTDKYCKLAPISFISVETVRFDTQKMENPEISGVEYQQGELEGYEVKEYLLEKWNRKCAYCDAENIPLQVEHIYSKSKGGSNKVSNLTLACKPCNKRKDNRPIQEFLSHDPARLKKILVQAKKPLKDAAVVNITRWAIYELLVETGLPVEVGTGGRTKYNRSRLGIPKTHSLDAACTGASTPDILLNTQQKAMTIKAVGRGKYQRTLPDKYGFPRGYLKRQKCVGGIKTGDIVKANILTGKHAGSYIGPVVIRHKGQFCLKLKDGRKVEGHRKYFTLIDRSAGYEMLFL